MQHNSFAGRELLRRLNHHPLVRARRDPHRNIELTMPETIPADKVALQGEWSLDFDASNEPIALVADDLRDFLKHAGIAVSDDSTQRIRLKLGEREDGFAVTVEPGAITLQGADVQALWAALVHLENQLRAAGAPLLTPGTTERRAAWPLQISGPAWGANLFVPDLSEEYLDDSSFRLMAHHGIDGMLLYGEWALYATGTVLPELEHPEAEKHIAMLADAARRAARYGIKLYYCAVGPILPESHPVFQRVPEARGARYPWPSMQGEVQHCLCSSDPTALEFHAQGLSNLFARVPELGGLIMIVGGEVFYHCYTRPDGARLGRTNCPRCAERQAEDVVADFAKVISTAIHKEAPQARVMTWTYSAHKVWSKDYNQLEFIDRLPDDIAFMTEIDQGQHIQKAGYVKEVWDYSIDLDRPSDRIVAQNLRRRQRGLDLVIKTEVAQSIELLHFPYVPCLPRLGRKWQGIRSLCPTGMLLRWGFIGVFDSIADRLSYEARWDPNFSPEGSSRFIADCLCGSAAPQVLEAWRHFDLAIGHLPALTLCDYYTGPMWLGPTHPLPTWEGEVPQPFVACCRLDLQGTDPNTEELRTVLDNLVLYSSEQMLSDPAPPVHPDDLADRQSVPHAGIDLWEREFTSARDLARSGWKILKAIDETSLTAASRAELEEQRVMGEYLYRTFHTTLNTLRFIRIKEEQGLGSEKLQTIARNEYENARVARSIFERAPWLNLNLRLDGAFPDSLVLLDAKQEMLQQFLGRA